MLETRSFEGSVEELSAFVTDVWRRSYGGAIPIPDWSADYFTWQLRWDDEAREQVIAVYDEGRLAGVLPGIPYDFHTPTGQYPGTLGSWLSVDPEYRRQGIGSRLREEMVRRHREQGLEFQLGYAVVGSSKAMGPKFWQPRRTGRTTDLRNVRLWTRVIDPIAVADWSLSGGESAAARYIAPLFPLRKVPTSDWVVRDYQPGDLDACLALLDPSPADLAVAWNPAHLSHHLAGHPISRTLVATKDDVVQGVVNYHTLPFRGKTELPIAIVDLFATSTGSSTSERQFLRTMLLRMRDEGVGLVLMRVTGNVAGRTLIGSGFIPQSVDSKLIVTWAGDGHEWKIGQRVQMLWR